MTAEPFYWAVIGSNHQSGGMEYVAICEEKMLGEAQEQAHIHYFRVQVLPVTVHESVLVTSPVALEVAAAMRDLLWGKPGSNGPGKVLGKQHRLRELSLRMVRLLKTKGDSDATDQA